ncbi:MAG TPA: AraC family transcriptional regulator [Opitutaceae bacterium]
MKARKIPSYPLSDYVPPSIAELGIFVERFEVLETQITRPPGAHRHEHFELFWLRGPAAHFNDFERYPLPADRPSFILISPGQVHFWDCTEAIRGTLISFTSAFFDGREPPPSTLLDYGFVHRTEFPPVLTVDAAFAAEAEPLIARCEREFATRDEGWIEVMRCLLRLLLAGASRAHRRLATAPVTTERSQHLLQRLRAQIEAKFRTHSSVAAYARELGVTPGHLNDVVRELTGGTAGELIRTRILLEARRLLFHSELSVSEIAYHLGFADPSYFAKTFRKATGQAPGDFRAAIRKCHQTLRD